MKKLVIAALFVMGAVAVAASTVNAEVLGRQEQNQKAEQKVEFKCNPKTTTKTGAYGESETVTEGNCEFNGSTNLEQNQRQEILGSTIVLKEGRGGKAHVPVNTAMDTKTAAAAMGLTAIGGLAYIAKRKIA